MQRRNLTMAILLGACVVAGAALAARQQTDDGQPWVAGACYRATLLEGEQVQYTLRVVDAPRGDWVRVQSDPMSPRVPGTSRTPVWLNTAWVFALQQIECASFPRE